MNIHTRKALVALIFILILTVTLMGCSAQTKQPINYELAMEEAGINSGGLGAIDNTIYVVVINDEAQYSVWPVNKETAFGWRIDPSIVGSKDVCIAYINLVWTDARPLSLREKMDQMFYGKTTSYPRPTFKCQVITNPNVSPRYVLWGEKVTKDFPPGYTQTGYVGTWDSCMGYVGQH